MCFIEGNVLSLYKDEEIVRGCSFEFEIIDVKPDSLNSGFFVHIGSEEIHKFIYVNETEKRYLKLKFIEDIELGSFKKEMIVRADSLYIWDSQKLYETIEDL